MSGLAEQQAALVRALVAGGPIPAGIDATEVAVAAQALRRKRASEIGRYDPLVVHACGDRFHVLFDEWARDRPKVSTAADAAAFTRHLRDRGVQVRPSRLRTFLRRRQRNMHGQ
ncbi:hypothetical protein GCM10007304_37710 [Rhodococcoides trifolii]|uniref:SCO6045-like C-terminal domain-containing protein n=1 Tax=Rhodococcoides trifolii TaxID=908250 RepID=A0A917LG59_9NOCA|nr:hypothetical protein [Rhodococcus trifolii]GGG20260.1 hypothetical protein GCM10007304_37710 [Rhodococcus trifolii]